MADAVDLYKHYRNEIKHEMDLMLTRLNALLMSQSFIVIAYATSMVMTNSKWSFYLSLILPPFLALLGFSLTWEGNKGILAARDASDRWQRRLDALVKDCPDLIIWADEKNITTKTSVKAGKMFAVMPPKIFLSGWVVLFFLPLVLKYLLGSYSC
ncbi:hypothetical protein DT385_09510 [Pseudomonas syringae]|nr:hypothetical protein DT385_09510 [Pseudomonas syringae]